MSGVLGALAGNAGFSPYAQQFFTRITDPGLTRKRLYATLIDGLVADGQWTRLDALWIGAANSHANSLVNLKSSSFTLTEHGGVGSFFTVDQGWLSNASTRYYSTAFNESSSGTNYTLNANSIGWYNLTSDTTPSFYESIGCSDGTNGTFPLPLFSAGAGGGRLQSTGNSWNGGSYSNSNHQGNYCHTRTGSQEVYAYKNESQIGYANDVDAASSSLSNYEFFVLAQNSSGTASNPCINQRFAAFWIGGSMTAAQQGYVCSRINAYMTSLSINVY